MEYFPRIMHRRSSRVVPPPSMPGDGRGAWPGTGAGGGLGLGVDGEVGGGGEKGHGNLKSATTTSTFSWSTISQETSAHYDRMLFDYRVMAQSMHAYRHISIFRRFGRLSMANLLFYQDELKQVEEALASVDREETRWIQAGSEGSGDVVLELKETRIRLMRVLRETLKSYCMSELKSWGLANLLTEVDCKRRSTTPPGPNLLSRPPKARRQQPPRRPRRPGQSSRRRHLQRQQRRPRSAGPRRAGLPRETRRPHHSAHLPTPEPQRRGRPAPEHVAAGHRVDILSVHTPNH